MSAGSLSSAHDDDKAQANSRAAICHSKFYFDNEVVIFQVENTLFKVHKYQLLKSDVFSDMFGTARGDVEEDSSSKKPIVLDGVLKSDFEALLTVLYAPRFSTDQPELDSSFIVPAYRLANKWNFEDLRKCLMQLADKKLSEADRIVFARELA